jgi:acyl carrier protein
MNESEVKSIVFSILKKIAPDKQPETLKPNDSIREVLDIDSFDFLQFIIALDEKLGIDTPEEDYSKLATLNLLIHYVNSRK